MRNRVEHVFLVRFWRESGMNAKWRGCVDHVPAGARRYVTSPVDLTAYFEDRLESSAFPAENEEGAESAPRPG